MNRRSVLRSLALAPVVLLASRFAFAHEKPVAAPAAAAGGGTLPPLGENEPLAKAMQYVADATKAPGRSDKKATCGNCAKFNKCAPADKECKPVAKTAKSAPCEIFAGKSVERAGWCLSWTKA